MKTVYWSPWQSPKSYAETFLSYADPVKLIEDISPNINPNNTLDNFYKCPAFVNSIKNTYLFKSPTNCDVTLNEGHIINNLDNTVAYDPNVLQLKQPSMYNSYTVSMNVNWIFFSEESLEIESMHPYMHETSVSEHGYYVPGSYDISSWFRPLEYAFQLKPLHNRFCVSQDEPLLYIKFKTNEPVRLKKFRLTEELFRYSTSCIRLKMYRRDRNLRNLYGIFHRTKLRDMVLTEIKKNLL